MRETVAQLKAGKIDIPVATESRPAGWIEPHTRGGHPLIALRERRPLR
jgi:hypothetical protein